MKEFFKPADFIGKIPSEFTHRAAVEANEKLNEAIECAPNIYSKPGKYPCTKEEATHKAKMMFIEEIGCQHKNTKVWEPHLAGARKCLDCGFEKYSTSGPWVKEPCKHVPLTRVWIGPYVGVETNRWVAPVGFVCQHCGERLQATWSEKK